MSDYEGDESFTQVQNAQNVEQLAKKLVRLALACEFARQPIRRADISAKVLESQGRQFKNVFDEAQMQLKAVFGMQMEELPLREKVTVAQKRGAFSRISYRQCK